jgi:hypothetical protein
MLKRSSGTGAILWSSHADQELLSTRGPLWRIFSGKGPLDEMIIIYQESLEKVFEVIW